MGFEITLSLKNKKIDTTIIEKAYQNNCENYYTTYEIEGRRRTIHKNKYLMTFIFPENQIFLIKFLNSIKKKVKVETISDDSGIFRILYPIRGKLVESDKPIINALK